MLKNAKNLKKLLKINGLFFIKKRISLIVQRRTKRGSTVSLLSKKMSRDILP